MRWAARVPSIPHGDCDHLPPARSGIPASHLHSPPSCTALCISRTCSSSNSVSPQAPQGDLTAYGMVQTSFPSPQPPAPPSPQPPLSSNTATRDSPGSQRAEPSTANAKNRSTGDGWSHCSTGLAKCRSTSSSLDSFLPWRAVGWIGGDGASLKAGDDSRDRGRWHWRRLFCLEKAQLHTSSPEQDNSHTDSGNKQDRLS